MATANPRLIRALRDTATKLEQPEVTYKWSSFSNCNCGHLIQTITGLDATDLQRQAMMHDGDWGKQAHQRNYVSTTPPQPDYGDRPPLDEGAWEPENIGACAVTGVSMDFVFYSLEGLGLNAADIEQLERLSDPTIRRRLGAENAHYPHHVRENVIQYLRTWADMLEEQLPTEPAFIARRTRQTSSDMDNTPTVELAVQQVC